MNSSAVSAPFEIIKEGKSISDISVLAELFNAKLLSIYAPETVNNFSIIDVVADPDVIIGANDVASSLSAKCSEFSVGPDGIPMHFWNRLKYVLSEPLAFRFNQFLKHNYFPEE